MAINSKIVTKIKQKSKNDHFICQSIIEVLSQLEEGKQGKRAIEREISKMNKSE